MRCHIQQHPVEYYKRLRAMLENHSNPEVGHYIERAWGAIFWPYPSECMYRHI